MHKLWVTRPCGWHRPNRSEVSFLRLRDFVQRLLVFLLTPIVACVLVTGVALWILVRPRGFQQFVADAFVLLPQAGPQSRITPIVLRLLAVPMLYYAYTMGVANRGEIQWLVKIFTQGSN